MLSSEPNPTNRFIRPKELTQIVGLSRTTIWRMEKEGTFPQRRQLSSGAVGWLWSDVQSWLENRPPAVGAGE